MAIRTFQLGTVAVPLHARYTLEQSYEPRRAVWQPRLASGSMIQRTRWSGKLATTVRGAGRAPAGLMSLDYTATMSMYCIAGRAISSTSRTITLPTTRRTDTGATPIGRAWVGDEWYDTTLSIAANVATLSAVSGATLYQVVYWPLLTVYAQPPTEEWQQNGDHTWSLTAEEA
jgi:hypothetical protein